SSHLERGAVPLEGSNQISSPAVDLGRAAQRRCIVGSLGEHRFELALGLVKVVQLQERSTEGDPSRQIAGVEFQAGAAAVDRLLKAAGPAILFRELSKRDRGRIQFDAPFESL